jgi:hypothetical protein
MAFEVVSWLDDGEVGLGLGIVGERERALRTDVGSA